MLWHKERPTVEGPAVKGGGLCSQTQDHVGERKRCEPPKTSVLSWGRASRGFIRLSRDPLFQKDEELLTQKQSGHYSYTGSCEINLVSPQQRLRARLGLTHLWVPSAHSPCSCVWNEQTAQRPFPISYNLSKSSLTVSSSRKPSLTVPRTI